jgi:hypothetical protein
MFIQSICPTGAGGGAFHCDPDAPARRPPRDPATATRSPPLGSLRAGSAPAVIHRRTVQWLTPISAAAMSTLT